MKLTKVDKVNIIYCLSREIDRTKELSKMVAEENISRDKEKALKILNGDLKRLTKTLGKFDG